MRVSLVLVLVLYLIAGTLFALYTPRWQAPDEPAHFNYVQSVTQGGRLPLLAPGCFPADYLERLKSSRFAPELPVGSLCYEAHQPPLYYLLAMPVARAAAALGRDPLVPLRLFSVLIGAGVVLASAGLVRQLFPAKPLLAVAVAGLVATIPMHLTFLSAVNNDGLAELVLVLSVWQMLRLLHRPAEWRRWLALGVLLGLALITKTTAYIAVPLAILTALLAARAERCAVGRVVRGTGAALGVALLFGMPWFARNSRAYGGFDLLGLGRHDEIVVGQLRTAEIVAARGLSGYLNDFLLTTFHSFWGQFGWMAAPLPGWVYSPLLALTAAGVVGLALFVARAWRVGRAGGVVLLSPLQWRGLVLLASWVALNLGIYVWYNLTFVQFQGRYLFPSLVAIATFLSLGWSEWIASRRQRHALAGLLGALWVLDLWSLFAVIVPQLSP